MFSSADRGGGAGRSKPSGAGGGGMSLGGPGRRNPFSSATRQTSSLYKYLHYAYMQHEREKERSFHNLIMLKSVFPNSPVSRGGAGGGGGMLNRLLDVFAEVGIGGGGGISVQSNGGGGGGPVSRP